MLIEWNDGFRIGNAAIDEQHQQLFDLANRFMGATDQAAQTLCAMELYRHTREHFAMEEALMRELQFPYFQEHVAAHNDLISRLNVVSEGIGRSSLSAQDVQAFMSEWALQHIPKSDAKLSAYVADR